MRRRYSKYDKKTVIKKLCMHLSSCILFCTKLFFSKLFTNNTCHRKTSRKGWEYKHYITQQMYNNLQTSGVGSIRTTPGWLWLTLKILKWYVKINLFDIRILINMPVDQNLLRYLIAAPATMFSSNTEVPPRLFTTSATLSPKHKIDNEGNLTWWWWVWESKQWFHSLFYHQH